MINSDSLSNILYIDLSKKRSWVKKRDDLIQDFIGGAGVAIHLLKEECPEGIDPLSPENPIILCVGPLTGLFPMASKTVAMFKSPLTGNLGESHAGGRSAIAIRLAGYGAIVVKGSSEVPIYLAIYKNQVYFKDATTMWGMKSSFTPGTLMRQNESGSGLRAIMRIGLAGENSVSYSAVTTETFRHFGRLGMGAVFGSKNLKGIVISANNSIEIKEKRAYKKLYADIYDQATSSSLKKYHHLGTAGNINPLNLLKALPTKNLKSNSFPNADKISGENLAKNYLGRRLACAHCPVACIHIAALREPYGKVPYFYKTTMVGYDYEPIFALGTMLGIDEPEGLLKLIDIVEKVCIDAMSAGVVMAWATEMLEKKLISKNDTDGLDLEWGNSEIYIKAVEKITSPPNDFYRALGKGCAYASDIYGGKDFALTFGKNEMPGYHTGPVAYLGFLLGCRHSHLDNAGYSIDQKELMGKTLSPSEIVDKIIDEEQWRQILSSLVICFFSRGIYTPDLVREALGLSGFSKSNAEINNISKIIYKEKFQFKLREGFSFDNLEMPKRIFETPSPSMPFDQNFIRDAIQYAKKTILKKHS